MVDRHRHRHRHLRRHGTLPLLALLALAACGSTPADESTAGVDSASDATEDTPDEPRDTCPQGDCDRDTVDPCDSHAGFDCATDCDTDVSFSPVCDDGVWSCPPEYPIRFDECDFGCEGASNPCCDATGNGLGDQMCVQGAWSCSQGDAGWCCPDADVFDCVSGCGSDAIQRRECERGRLVCPEGTIQIDECEGECIGRPVACCQADGLRVDPVCNDGSWSCPDGASGDLCRTPPAAIEGTWFEVGRLACDGAQLPAGDDPVAELRIMGSAAFDLTFASGMFETFRHYWGDWMFDPESGRLTLRAEGGNMDTDGLDLDGRVIQRGARVEFRDMWFGDAAGGTNSGECGYIMERR